MESGQTLNDILHTDVAVLESETAREADQQMQVVTGKNVVNALLGATCHSQYTPEQFKRVAYMSVCQ